MADAYLSTSDVVTFNKTDMDLLVNDVLNESPFLAALAARPVRSNTFVYNRESAAPAVGFRAVNDGVENLKSTRAQVTCTLGVLDASFAVDKAAAMADERGWQHIMAVEAMSHLRQAMSEVEQQIINGTNNVATNAFNGFADQTNLDDSDDGMVVDAGGSTASTGSSVYLVRAGEADVQALWGQQGVIDIGDMQEIERDGSSSGRFPAYYHSIVGWCGVKVGSTYSVARIANLTEDSGKGLTDDLIYDALSLFPASRQPNLIVMNRRSLKQLRASRTATSPSGAPAARPDSVDGIPVIVTDSITSTETLLTPA